MDRDFTNSNKSKLIHKRIQVFLFILAQSMKQILLVGDKNFHMSQSQQTTLCNLVRL